MMIPAPKVKTAADGAKFSLWRLYREGLLTVACVHDKMAVELPEQSDHSTEAEKRGQLMASSMSEVVDPDIPLEVEFSLSSMVAERGGSPVGRKTESKNATNGNADTLRIFYRLFLHHAIGLSS